MTSTYASSILRKTLGRASRSKKPQNQTQRADFPKKGNLQKPKPFSFMLILLALLCGRSVAWAQAQGEWNGSATNDTYTISSDMTINSTVTIGNTDVLTLLIKADVTISRNNTQQGGLMFYVKPGGTLNIIGDPKPADAGGGYYKATFVGGSDVVVDHPTLYQAFEGDYVTTVANKRGIMWNNLGKVTIKHARITGFQVRDGNGTGSRGVINLVSDKSESLDPNNAPTGIMLMEDVEIDHCWGGPAIENGSGVGLGRIISLQGGNWDATLKNVELHHCFSCEHPDNQPGIHHFGGIIRTEGGISGTLTVEDCRFYNNKYKYWKRNDCKLIGQGGVINWRAAGSGASDTKLIIKDSKFYNNQAAEGGAIATNATIEMSNVEIYNNKAFDGGGVYFWTYNGGKNEYDGRAFDATFGNDVNIHDNTATQYGGGIYIGIDASDDVGFKAKTSGEEWNPVTDTASVLFNVEIQTGATIEGNKAPKGAGIAIRDAAPYRHMNKSPDLVGNAGSNPAYGEWSGVYRREVNIAGGTVCNNTTTGDEMAGAGIYIEKYEYPADHTFHSDYNYGNAPGTYGAGTLTVNAESGLIYGNTAINGIKPGFGGGMYIASKFETNTIKSTLNVNIGETGKNLEMYNNQAYTDGGGVYVWYDRTNGRKNEGTVTVKGGTIGKIEIDETDPENPVPVLCPNKALNGNGGGICVMSGTVVVKNGHVDYNTANQKGGGIYLDDGNLTFTGGNVDQNEASNSDGGGICVEGGNIVVSGGTVSNNEAKLSNGGGISVLGGTVLVEGGHIISNTANELGGGVYVSVQDATIITKIRGGANISNNQAKGGGGVYVDKGILKLEGEGFAPGAYGQTQAEADDTHTRITNNTATDGNGGGINAGNGTVDITNTLIYNNTASGTDSKGRGGGIYLDGGTIEINTSKILYNTAKTSGGGICVLSGAVNMKSGDVGNNNAQNNHGGGICVMSGTVEVEGGHVDHNTANQKGGGIYLYGGDLTFTEGSVDQNEASNNDGGGICVESGNIVVSGGTVSNNEAKLKNGGGICVLGGTVRVEGGNILTNTANELGGGVYVNVQDATIITKIRGGANISNNQAKGGGGVYVDKGILKLEGEGFASGAYGQTQAETDNTHTRITNNKATDGNGGGINADEGEVDLTNTLIFNNTASGTGEYQGRGGGVYLNGGTIVITDSKILYNTAALNGGGVDNHDGDIDIYGGDISENTATTGNGGGIYTNLGDILVWPTAMKGDPDNVLFSQCELTKTTVLNNKAGGNGGGLNTHTGRFDVRFAQISNNTAGHNYSAVGTNGGNGGGLFCDGTEHDNGYTVRLLHCDLEKNKAHGNVLVGDGITGRGGGVYLKKGSIFAELCDIIENEADINGGGLDNHSGELRVYGTYINENVAHEGRGGGLYTEEGNIVVGPCDTYGYTASKASRIIKNKAKLNGGGINNHRGDITIHGDIINENEAETGDGGGVYIKEGNIFMYGGQINNNKANKGKGGGVYGGGGKFNIKERKANPIVEILEVEDIMATRFKVHYHLVDRGLAPTTTPATALSHGIAYSTIDPRTTPWTDSIVINYNSGTHSYVLSEGCVRIPVTGLTSASGTKYYIIAWAKYNIASGENAGNYYNASPVIEITAQDPTTQGKAPQGPRSVYPAVEENPFFMELTPLQQAMLASTPEGDTTAAPASRAITGRDNPQPQPPVDIPEINENTAMFGGGICIDKKGAELVFSGRRGEVQEDDKLGQINKNFASEAGGGIYIGYQTEGDNIGPAMMQMMGKCEVNYNHVPAGKQGGGIYLDGRLYVGDKKDDLKTVHGLRVDRNFTSSMSQEEWLRIPKDLDPDDPNYATLFQDSWDNPSFKPGEYNNVFLTRYDYNYHVNINDGAPGDNNVSVITLLSDISGFTDTNGNHKLDEGESPYSHIGFSVLQGFCPVIATASEFGGAYNTVQTTDVAPDNPNLYENWLFSLMMLAGAGDDGMANTMKGAVFEDSESYVAVHTRRNIPPFLGKFIYLWGCWTHPIVMTDPETDNHMKGSDNPLNPSSDPKWKGHYVITNPEQNTADGTGEPLKWEIYSPEGLAWFTSYVNGLNVFDEVEGGETGENAKHFKWDAKKNPKANAKIMNDLDMSAYLWVPIGSVQKFFVSNLVASTDDASLFYDSENEVPNPENVEPWYSNNKHYYCGTFNGQGHVIKGIQGLFLTGIRKYGLFGYLAEGAVVKNTFVDDGLFVSDGEEIVYSAGGIAGEMKAGTLSNSEARMTFNVTYSHDDTYVGGLVGKMSGTAVVHSSMAMPEIVGTAGYMGGLVGQVGTNSKLLNSFANPYFPNAKTSPYYDIYGSGAFIGGLVGDNQGVVENCYTRLRGAEPTYDGTHSVFGWFAGTNSVEAKEDKMGGIRFCYAPAPANPTDYVKSIAYPNIINGSFGIEVVNPDPGIEEPFGSGNYSETERVSGKYGFKHRDHNIEATNDYVNNDTLIGGLQRALNAWVKDAENNGWNATTGANDNGYAVWTRTMASTINDDYPVLMLGDFNCVGSKDKIYLLYEDDVNHLWNPTTTTLGVTTPGKDFKACNVAGSVATMYMYDAQPLVNVSSDPESPVLKPCDVTISGNTNVPLYIHEDVGITQEDDKLLTARVGVTIKDDNWHLFSSALSGIPIGIKYQTEEAIPNECGDPYAVTKNTYTNRNKFDPIAKTLFYQKDNPDVNSYYPAGIGYFPTDTPYGTWRPDDGGQTATDEDVGGYFDLYDYSESYYHWVNYKRNDNDHWHMDEDKKSYHQKFAVDYVNDRVMVHGKGYLMALSEASMMMADGVLNNSDQTLTLSKSDNGANFQTGSNAQPNNGYTAIWRGIHLLGNPYQSYLDFNAQSFGKANGKVFNTYAIVDESLPGRDHYIYYTKNQSRNAPLYADGYIHPHQGFFVKVEGSQPQTFEFTTGMRIAGTSAEYGEFRDNVDYPLVNLLCFDEDGERDLTTVEVNRPEVGGGEKMESLHKSKGMIYAQFEGESFQVLFAPEGVTTVPVRFEAKEDGVFTLNWHTLHGNFSYLHLIDNITGVDVDCLTADEYKFEGKMSDYRSRFKLVFRCEGDEPEDPEDPDAPEDEDPDHFAFIFGNELVVNGEGILQMFDIQGRCLMETQAIGSQSNHNLPRVSAGVYLLRLTGDKKVRVQKMVIK